MTIASIPLHASQYGAGKTLELTCPKHMVGRVIGRGGETVKGLQRQYGAAIQIEQNANPCRVTITGPPGAVAAAERAILDLVEDRPPGGPGFGGGFGAWSWAGMQPLLKHWGQVFGQAASVTRRLKLGHQTPVLC